MNQLRRLNNSRLLFDIWLVAVVMLYIAIFALTPMCVDDYFYSFHSASLTSPFDKAAAIWQNCQDRWHFDTGRLCNLMAPVFLGLFPKIVFSIISGLFIWMSVRLMCRLAGVGRGSVGSWVIVFLLNFALPWFEYMFTVIFALNYVWPSALSLLFVYWMLNYNAVVEKQSPSRFVVMCGIALLTGWMHEGFSVPVIAGMVATWGLTKRRPEKRELILFFSYVAGFILIVISPALWYRTEHIEPYFTYFSTGKQILYGVGCNLLFYVFCGCLVYESSKRKFRLMLKEDREFFALIVFIIVSSLAALMLFFKFYTGPRMGWFATQFGSIGVVALGRRVFSPQKHLVGAVIKSSIAFTIVLNLTAAVVEQERLYRENKEIVELFLKSPNGDVYYDNLPRNISFSLYKTTARYFNLESRGWFSYYWREDDNIPMILLPTKLKDFDHGSATPCPSDSTLYMLDGLLLSRDLSLNSSRTIMINTPKLGWLESSFYPKPFTAIDGTRWDLIVPYISSLAGLDITDARFIDEPE